jgi:hypothetical protein
MCFHRSELNPIFARARNAPYERGRVSIPVSSALATHHTSAVELFRFYLPIIHFDLFLSYRSSHVVLSSRDHQKKNHFSAYHLPNCQSFLFFSLLSLRLLTLIHHHLPYHMYLVLAHQISQNAMYGLGHHVFTTTSIPCSALPPFPFPRFSQS